MIDYPDSTTTIIATLEIIKFDLEYVEAGGPKTDIKLPWKENKLLAGF